MSKINNILNAIQDNVDGDDIIAFGFFCDTTEQPAHAKGFVIGKPTELAECLAHIMEDKMFHKVITKAIAMRVKDKIFNLKEEQDESGHICLN